MKNAINVIYKGGPTIILEIGGLRLMTDPTLDPPGEMLCAMANPDIGKSTTDIF